MRIAAINRKISLPMTLDEEVQRIAQENAESPDAFIARAIQNYIELIRKEVAPLEARTVTTEDCAEKQRRQFMALCAHRSQLRRDTEPTHEVRVAYPGD